MSTSQKTVDFILDQLADLGGVSARKMFGEFTLYFEGKIVGLICDDSLFIKITESGRRLMNEVVEASPYPGAKPCFRIDDGIENREWLCEVIRQTEKELPEPKKRAAKK